MLPRRLRNELICFLVLSASASAVNVVIPVGVPRNAVHLSRSLVSFSLEQDRWTDWAGTSSVNTFFYNTLDNLKKITGEAPWIRVGADSEDRTDFSSSVRFSQAVFPEPHPTFPYPEAIKVVVGDGFYQAVSHLPSGTHVIWGLNLKANNVTSTYLNARSLVKAFQSPAVQAARITLDYIEIGNEPDLYHTHGFRKSPWNMDEYVKQWSYLATNVTRAIGITASSKTKLIGGSFAESTHKTSGFSPQSLFHTGVLGSTAGSLIKLYSQHHYSGTFCFGTKGLLSELMSKEGIRKGLSPFKPDVSATRERGLDYILGETNSYSCHGAPNVSNTAGAALWTLDYALYAAQLGISRLFFHEGVGYKYNLIQPTTLSRSVIDGRPIHPPLAPHVQPQYYAAIIIAEAIGNSGNASAIELPISDNNIAGYAFYERKKLKRALFINSRPHLRKDAVRGVKHLDLSLVGCRLPFKNMVVKRLKITHAEDTQGLKWGGQSYETANGKISGSPQTTTIPVKSGLDIMDTEAILLTFT